MVNTMPFNLPFDSTMLLSPIFLDSTRQSTSKTLLLPITIVSSPLNNKYKINQRK
jgi:hypothetical protein